LAKQHKQQKGEKMIEVNRLHSIERGGAMIQC
jgi:hypothetical protein